MDIATFLQDWIAISNSYDTERYLEKFLEDAVLDDPSVGRQLVDGDKAHLEVEFTGEFPEGKIGGLFDFVFRDEKIAAVKANLM